MPESAPEAPFEQSASDALGRLAALAERLSADPGDGKALGKLCEELHQLADQAGAQGFPAAARLCVGMEVTAADWLTTAPGDLDRAGAARWFLERLCEALDLPLPLPPVEGSGTDEGRVGTGTPQIIIVEDDRVLVDMLEYGLKTRGYQYAVYRDGQEALEALLALELGDEQPLVLLDVDLPGVDGYALLDRLSAERPGAYRVVFTTGHGSEEDQVRGFEAGAVDYLVKPISLRVALEKISRWVPPPPPPPPPPAASAA